MTQNHHGVRQPSCRFCGQCDRNNRRGGSPAPAGTNRAFTYCAKARAGLSHSKYVGAPACVGRPTKISRAQKNMRDANPTQRPACTCSASLTSSCLWPFALSFLRSPLAPQPGARSERGTATRSRSPFRRGGRISRCRRRRRVRRRFRSSASDASSGPRSMPHLISIPTPGMSSVWNGSSWKIAGFALVHVFRQEAAGVVAREAHGRLRQVVGAEREEFGDFGDLGRQATPRAEARSSCPPDSEASL